MDDESEDSNTSTRMIEEQQENTSITTFIEEAATPISHKLKRKNGVFKKD